MVFRPTSILFAVLCQVVVGIEIRTYDPDDHNRFIGLPSSPSINPNQDFAHLDLTGVGWFVASPDIQFALISRQHVLFASHFAGVVSPPDLIRFLNASGQAVTRTVPTEVLIQEGGLNTDLALFTLSSPIDESLGIRPLQVIDASDPLITNGLPLIVSGKNPSGTAGKFPVIAQSELEEVLVDSLELDFGGDGSIEFTTRAFRFDYTVASGGPDECHFVVGDSGSPTVVDRGGVAALIGVHSARNPVTDIQGTIVRHENYDSFVPDYVDEIDALIAPLGYRVRQTGVPTTTVAGVASVLQPVPRQAMPLDLKFDIENTGANPTGNLEVEFHFPVGSEPDSVTAAGWVTYGSGEKWTLRRSMLAPSVSHTLTASWSVAPVEAELNPTLVWRSDTVGDQTVSPMLPLLPSYAAWAADLVEAGQEQDPDSDGLVNLMEYALGGNAESGVMIFADGGPLQPILSLDAGQVYLRYPERSDKIARGVGYALEFSPDLNGWSSDPPAGISSTTVDYVPAVDGFEQALHQWPVSPAHRFVRLVVTLSE